MEFLTDNWPLIVAILATIVVITSVIKKLLMLALLAGVIAVGALFLWPYVSDQINF